MESTVTQLVSDEIDRIGSIAPFDALPRGLLSDLLFESPLLFCRAGQSVCDPATSQPGRHLWLVRQGTVVRGTAGYGDDFVEPEVVFGTASLFALECALETEMPLTPYIAREDCFLWRIEGRGLDRLCAEPGFLGWLARRWQTDLARLRQSVLVHAKARQVADQALALPARSAGAGSVVCVPADTSLATVAATMAERRIGSVVVGTPTDAKGIVTQSDLVRRAMAKGVASDAPVCCVMTPSPGTVGESASVFEAGTTMAERGYRHLLIRDSEGSIVGIVSERDLFRAQEYGIVNVFKPIGTAGSVEELVEVVARVREHAERVFRQGMEVAEFARLVTSINDRIVRRVADLVGSAHALPSAFCWLSFGSEGREEQGFVTDQDNGICFLAADARAADCFRPAFLDFARQMNDALHECGFERCKGNIMASNPNWCLSLEEWKDRFTRWISSTTPEALLNATIFFDFRGLFGDRGFAEALRDHLAASARGNTIFLAMLARNALDVAPPVGRLGGFVTAGGAHKGTIDLKTQGSRLFVDAARVLALATGVRSSGTEQRLRIGGQRAKRSPMAIEGDVAAFRFVQKLRMQRQLDSLRDGGDPNRIVPPMLNEIDQRILKESLHQAQGLQGRLRMDFQR